MAKKKTVRKKQKRSTTKSILLSPDTLVLKLDKTTQAKLKKVFKDGGSLELKFDEMSVTKLPDIGSVAVDPVTNVQLSIKRPKSRKKAKK